MAHYYADSSVLVKRHIRKMGSLWFETLALSGNGWRTRKCRWKPL